VSADRCLFCRIVNGEIPARKAYEDDDVVAFHDVNPQAPVHILIIPRRHIASLDDLTPADAGSVGNVIVKATKIARDLHLEEDGYRLVVNMGPAAGQSVFHIHFHILGGRNFGWPPG
jgi:histidine triad (HIT) family protein